MQRLKTAETYEQWEDTAFELDELLGLDLWYDLESWQTDCPWCYNSKSKLGVKTQQAVIMTTGLFSGDWRL